MVLRSIAEAEYWGMAHGIWELLWLRYYLQRLGLDLREVFCYTVTLRQCRKLLTIQFSVIEQNILKWIANSSRKKLDAILVDIPYVKSAKQLVDVLTH